MAKWIITKDIICDGDDDGVRGPTTPEGLDPKALPYRFKMYDDDGELYYEGRASSESFDPLDDFGTPNTGCTEIKYSKGGGPFETL
ncbi:MAG: hypothetical protein GY841_23530 [FCB group bacterium]|nr:hypothetical protein [FCB group bacterium]